MCRRRSGIWCFETRSRRRTVLCGLRFVPRGEDPRCKTGTWGTLLRGLALLAVIAGMAMGISLRAQGSSNPDAPAVMKVEPPSWWVGLTPDVMLLLSGRNLRATHVSCNLRDVVASRTESSSDGNYLFVWLK